MKTRYTIIASLADDGLISVERNIDGNTDLVAAFEGIDMDDIAGIYQMTSEMQELADNADELHTQNQVLEKLRAGNRALIEQRDALKEQYDDLDRDKLRMRLDRALTLLTEVDEDPQSQLSGTLSLDINAFLKEPK